MKKRSITTLLFWASVSRKGDESGLKKKKTDVEQIMRQTRSNDSPGGDINPFTIQ